MEGLHATVLRALRHLIKPPIEPPRDSLLIIGAGNDDLEIAQECGFKNIRCSNLDGSGGMLTLDAEAMNLSNGSYDVVFAHAVLHHCASPHKAVLEAVRVCRKAFIFLEGNDSLLMRVALRLGASSEYEDMAVRVSGGTHGGLRNTAIPNYVYRWTPRDLKKTLCSGFPQNGLRLEVRRFFDFYAVPEMLDARREPIIQACRTIIGSRNMLRGARTVQAVINSIPGIRSQGNHFLAVISKA
jgi:SAM-dependent methyltransferase